MREQITTCYGCGVELEGPPAAPGRLRWCERCGEVAGDIKAAERLAQRYGLPPETPLGDVALAIREQLREGGRARDRAELLAFERERREQNIADRQLRRHWWDLMSELAPLSSRTPRDDFNNHRDLEAVERELFGDIAKRKRWEYLQEFAYTTYRDDGVDPRYLLSDARAYLLAKVAEERLAEASVRVPTMDETRPGSRERT